MDIHPCLYFPLKCVGYNIYNKRILCRHTLQMFDSDKHNQISNIMMSYQAFLS